MLVRFNKTVPSVFDEFFGREFHTDHYRNGAFKRVPAVNISEEDEEFVIEVAAPGLEKKHFRINLDQDQLTISSEMKEKSKDRNDQYTRREFGYQEFSRSFRLPDTVDSDAISASHKDGILYVHVPKREEAKVKPARQIAIQ